MASDTVRLCACVHQSCPLQSCSCGHQPVTIYTEGMLTSTAWVMPGLLRVLEHVRIGLRAHGVKVPPSTGAPTHDMAADGGWGGGVVLCLNVSRPAFPQGFLQQQIPDKRSAMC